MGPRAACRLEALGFPEVFAYAEGKAGWAASGRPTEGITRIIGNALQPAQTCLPDDTVGVVAIRSPTGMVVVTDGDGVVLGRLRRRHLRDEAQDSPVAEVMLAGPSTYRPNVPVEEMNSRLDEHGLHSAIVTKPDGTLLGLYVRPDGRARGSR